MNHAEDSNRRRFLRTTLAAAGTTAMAASWGRVAEASVPGRAVIVFQVPPSGTAFFTELLSAIRVRYQPDLGTRPVAMPGAAGGVAMETVARSPLDGGTVLIAPSTMLSLVPIVWKTPVDPVDTLVPVAGIGGIALGFMVGPAVPAEVLTMSDYVRWVRANPRSNSYGVPGLGTLTHYVGAEIGRLADVPLHVVGYKGVLGLMEDVANGSIPAVIAPMTGRSDMARLPQLRLLAVTGDQRFPWLPEIPTLRESGMAESTPSESLGIFMPKGTPDERVQELSAAVQAATASRLVGNAMTDIGMYPIAGPSNSYAATMADERATWKALVARHNFTVGR